MISYFIHKKLKEHEKHKFRYFLHEIKLRYKISSRLNSLIIPINSILKTEDL